MSGYALLVVWLDGSEEYLKEGTGPTVARFRSKKTAEEHRDFLLIGISDEVQSVNVVAYPSMKERVQ